MFKIYDTKLKLYTRGSYKSRRVAQHKADKLDNEYGAYRYFVHEAEIRQAVYATERDIFTFNYYEQRRA